jgi:hypothetical protein
MAACDEEVCRSMLKSHSPPATSTLTAVSTAAAPETAAPSSSGAAATATANKDSDPSDKSDELRFPRLLLLLIKSLDKPELVHRALVLVLNLLTAGVEAKEAVEGEGGNGSGSNGVTANSSNVLDLDGVPVRAAALLCKAGIIPVLGEVLSVAGTGELGGSQGTIAQLAARIAQELTTLVEDV